ncbi:MAG: phosphoribosylglycinamide formyltransferase [Planctomycetota bacterium]|nr:phosphoribosylglycinamide formyltransferase [Planctomycetota bacterium]
MLISGSGRTLVNLAERIERGELPAQIGLVIASRECLGADRSRELGFPTVVQRDLGDGEAFERTLREHGADWVALAGYLRLAPTPPSFAGRIVNIHPALLPSFGGRGMYGLRVHEAVLEAGCKVSGCTVHLCDEAYDTGPIVAQRTCEVLDDDTAESLAARVFELEKEVFPAALRLLIEGRVSIEGRRTRIIGS